MTKNTQKKKKMTEDYKISGWKGLYINLSKGSIKPRLKLQTYKIYTINYIYIYIFFFKIVFGSLFQMFARFNEDNALIHDGLRAW